MRVLIVTQYYPPETGGPQNRLASLAAGFLRNGHNVHVITEKPNYPTGVVWPEYRGKLFRQEQIAGIPVIQCAIWEDKKKSFLTRIRFYLSFVITSILASFKLRGKFDIVIASSPPLFVGLSGWVIGRIKRAKYIFDVRDLWPDVAIAMGELSNKRAASLAKSLEKFIYRKADGITAVTTSFCNDIQRIAGPSKPVERVMNGTVPDVFTISTPVADMRDELGLGVGKYVGFIGNMGLAQGLDHVVDAARELEDSDINFLFVGDGARKEAIVESAGQLKNIEFRGRVDLSTAAKYMAACDALIVSLGDNPIYKKFIPSKLFDTMAAGKPMLLNVDGESRSIMEQAQAGLYYKAEDGMALALAIRNMFSGNVDLEKMAGSGRVFVVSNYTREAQADIVCEFAASLVDSKERRPNSGVRHVNELAA